MSSTTLEPALPKTRKLHPVPIRIMHWLNAIAMLILIGSGWGIYDDEVIFGWLYFPPTIKLGNWAANSIAFHFAAMWLLIVNGLAYLVYGFVTGRLRQRMLPIRPREVIHEVLEALRFRLAHDDLTTYNAVQKLLYVIVILAGIMQVVTGLAIWKPVQFSWITAAFGSFQNARIAHFLGMAVIVGFVVVHVTLALLVPKTLVTMVTGGPRIAVRARSKV